MKKVFLGLMCLVSFGFAEITPELFDRAIANSSGSQQQVFKCNKAVMFNKKNADPQICIKATEMIKELNNPNDHDMKNLGESYLNAGVLYAFGEKYHNDEKALKMFLLSYDSGYEKVDSKILNNIGYFYWKGRGTTVNKMLAHKYFMEGAKIGNVNCQYNLDLLCKESPWACK